MVAVVELLGAMGTCRGFVIIDNRCNDKSVNGVVPSSNSRQACFTSASNNEVLDLPSVEQVCNDPFMKQVEYSSIILSELTKAKDKATTTSNDKMYELGKLIQSQFSHSDGIRGFFVNYLTTPGSDTLADEDIVPSELMEAMQSKTTNQEDLTSLLCMNVIMPTAMSTLHQDPELANNSKLTAKRGKRVLMAAFSIQEGSDELKRTCQDILVAATTSTASLNDDSGDSKAKNMQKKQKRYWKKFFDNYGYKEKQLSDIASAFEEIME